MNRRGDAAADSTLNLGLILAGVLFGGFFFYSGARMGSESLVKNELYAKDLALLTDSVLSLPLDTDLVLTYPHDFRGYRFSLQDSSAVVENTRKEPARTAFPFLNHSRYQLDLPSQEDHVKMVKLKDTITTREEYAP